MESNRTGRRTVLGTAGPVAAKRVGKHLSVPIVTTALALALAACGAGGTAQNAGSNSTTQGGGSGKSAEHTDDISVGVKPDAKAVKLLPAAVKAKGTLSVAMDLAYPPTTFMASDNKTPCRCLIDCRPTLGEALSP